MQNIENWNIAQNMNIGSKLKDHFFREKKTGANDNDAKSEEGLSENSNIGFSVRIPLFEGQVG